MIEDPERMFMGITKPIKEERKKVFLNGHLSFL